jgi:hypothetical protein
LSTPYKNKQKKIVLPWCVGLPLAYMAKLFFFYGSDALGHKARVPGMTSLLFLFFSCSFIVLFDFFLILIFN